MDNERIVTLTAENFEQEVLKSTEPVVVDFWAEWCGPCKMIAPLLEELAVEKAGQIKFAKIDVEKNQEIISRFEIRAVPTLVLFKDGQVKETIVGLVDRKSLEKKLALAFV